MCMSQHHCHLLSALPHLRLHALLQLRLLSGQAVKVGAGSGGGGALRSQRLLRLPACEAGGQEDGAIDGRWI